MELPGNYDTDQPKTNRQTNQPTNRPTDGNEGRVHTEVKLQVAKERQLSGIQGQEVVFPIHYSLCKVEIRRDGLKFKFTKSKAIEKKVGAKRLA